MTAQPESTTRVSSSTFAVVAVLGAALVWSYWTTLARVAWRWSEDPQYSHGYLVPAFALYLLWLRRDRLTGLIFNVSWLGLGLLTAAVGMRLAGAYFHFEYFDQISLLPCCGGLFLLAGGWPTLAWSWPAIAFLAFMIPLPDRVSFALSAPMQAFATAVSTFVLQVVGRPAIAEGNVILLNDIELGIVEACSGLRMLVVFFALSTAVAMLIRKPMWEKLVIAGTAVPIALVSNVLRIVITGLCTETFGPDVGVNFHDMAGLLMPLIGIIFLGIELWILKTLLIEPTTDVASQVTLQRVAGNPLAMYQDADQPRRKKAKKAEDEIAAPTPDEAIEPAVQS